MSDIKVTFKRASVEASTEVGSFSELAGLIQDESSTLMKIFGDDMETVIQRLGVPATTTEQQTGGEVGSTPPPAETPAQKKKREKAAEAEAKAAAEKAAALTATAVAPDPLPIPAQNSNDPLAIPADLVRSPNVPVGPPLAAAAPPPPPPTIPSPPLAAAAPPPPPPPVGVLGPKVVAALDALKAGNPADANGQALADWLHTCHLTQKGADYNAACRVVLMTSDAKLIEAGIPLALKIPA